MSALPTPIEVFYSYADADEDLCIELDKHLSLLHREGLITPWHKRRVMAGTDSSKTIDQHLNSASVILLLISADFVASDYCYGAEMQRAMQRQDAGEVRVIPILLRPVGHWQSTPFGKLQVLPRNGKPVTSWSNRDEAFRDIALSIRYIVQTFFPPIQGNAQPSSQNRPSIPPVSRSSRVKAIAGIGILLFLIGIAVFILSPIVSTLAEITSHPPVFPTASQLTPLSSVSQPTVPSTTQQKNTYAPDMQHLVLSNSLQNNSVEDQWDEGGSITTSGTCKFEQQSYQLVPLPLSEGLACYAQAPNLLLTDFTYEAKMTFKEGYSAGLVFCSQVSYPAKEYRFSIQRDGNYRLTVMSDQGAVTLKNGKSDAVRGDQANLLAVVVDQGNLGLYVDHQLLAQVHDATYTRGRIGFFTPESPSADSIIAASASDVAVWSR
jgi:hypothetical protein